MSRRRIVAAVVALAAGATLVGVSAPGAQAAPVGAAHGTTANRAGTVAALYSAAGFQSFLDAVTAQVHVSYPNAVLALADGLSPTGPTTRIDDVTTWKLGYRAVTKDRTPVVVSAEVTLKSRTATITAQPSPVFGLHIQQPLRMSPFEAALRIRIAGYRAGYDDIWLHQSGDEAPRYSFLGGGQVVTVDTVTGAVTPGL